MTVSRFRQWRKEHCSTAAAEIFPQYNALQTPVHHRVPHHHAI
jgi:hypothetical protein